MDRIYITKLTDRDLKKQIPTNKDAINHFFGVKKDKEERKFKGVESKKVYDVSILLATDPRFNNDLRKLLNDEAAAKGITLSKDDFVVISKTETKETFSVELITPSDSNYAFYDKITNNQKHFVVNITNKVFVPLNKFTPSTQYPRNRIFFGAPGTGKSYLLNNEKSILLSANQDNYERITFSKAYSYAKFVGTYKPLSEYGEIEYAYDPGPFMRVLVNALKSLKSPEPKPYLLIIEEINRADAASVFGEAFQLLDRASDGSSEYEINTSNDMRKYLAEEFGEAEDDYNKIKIPSNMYIWATMNSADQGVLPLDTAFKRRWDFEYVGINDSEVELDDYEYTLGIGSDLVNVTWNQLRVAINNTLSNDIYKINEDKLLGPFFISKSVLEENDNDKFINTFKRKVIMYLYEDAVKQKNRTFFENCLEQGKSLTYSSICHKFDYLGINIFPKEIVDEIKEHIEATKTTGV